MSNDEYDIIRVEALEAGDVLEDLLIKGQLGFATETPYKMLHKEIGGTTRKYTSDTGDRSQAGKITAVLTTGAQLRAQYNGTYYADFTVDNAGYLKVNASGGRIDLASKVLFSNGAQDYLWTSRGNSLALQGQKINTAVGLELFPYGPTGNADGTDSCAFRIYAKGSPADVANLSSMTFGFASGDAEFQISSATAGAGTSYPINFSTQGNANQFHLAITGNNGMGVAGSAAAKLAIRDVVTQLELEYDATKQTTFTVNSSGQLTITPSGAAVGIGITPSANVPLNLGRVGGAQLQLTDTGGVCLFTVNSDGNLRIDPTGGNVAINTDAVADVGLTIRGESGNHQLQFDDGTGDTTAYTMSAAGLSISLSTSVITYTGNIDIVSSGTGYIKLTPGSGELGIGVVPTDAWGILQLNMATNNIGFVDSLNGTESVQTNGGYITVKSGSATRYIQLFQAIA